MEKEEKKTEEVKVEEAKPEQTKKKGKTGLIIAIVAIILFILLIAIIAIAGLVIFFVVKPGSKTTTVPRTTQVDNKITITFETNCDDSIRPMDYVPGEDFTLPTPIYDKHTFDGWYLEDGTTQVTNDYEFTESITVYAHWTEIPDDAKTLTVTFDSKGGSKVKSMKFVCNNDNAATLKNLPTPKKDAYQFRVWEDKHGTPILNGASITCDGELKLYAAWDYDGPTAAPKLKCNVGTLDGENCVETKEAKTSCSGEREFEYDGKCVKLTGAVRKDTQRSCPKEHVTYKSFAGYVDGKVVNWGLWGCAYYKTEDTTSSTCTSHGFTWVNPENACYVKWVGNGTSNTCDHLNNYAYITNPNSYSGVNGLNGGCFPLSDKTKSCDDGYTLSGNKCVKVLGKATPVE